MGSADAPDRRCYGPLLNNGLRRTISPPSKEVDRLGVRDGDSVADLGAGSGFFEPTLLVRIGPRGRLLVVEPDGANLARISKRLGRDPRIRLMQTTAADLGGVPDGTIDRALLSLVLCCMVDKEGALDELWRVLRPGGRALVTYPRLGLGRGGRRALRVTPNRWDQLLRRRPWRSFPVPSSGLVTRNLLEKPEGVDPSAIVAAPHG